MPNQLIYVIDDDELSRELLVLMVTAEGHTTEGFASGEDTLAGLCNGKTVPETILTDLQMPGLCGNLLASELRALVPRAKLLAISARRPQPENISGFDGFLLKPFTAEQLRGALATPQKPLPQTTAVAPPATGVPVLDEGVYRRLSAQMTPTQLRQLFEFAVADAARRTNRLQSAAEAVDETAFVREAHALQGGCGMIGALELRSIARAMENQGLSAAPRLAEISDAMSRLRRMLETLIF